MYYNVYLSNVCENLRYLIRKKVSLSICDQCLCTLCTLYPIGWPKIVQPVFKGLKNMCTVTGPRRMTSLRLIKGVLKVLKVFEIQFYIVLAFRIEPAH